MKSSITTVLALAVFFFLGGAVFSDNDEDAYYIQGMKYFNDKNYPSARQTFLEGFQKLDSAGSFDAACRFLGLLAQTEIEAGNTEASVSGLKKAEEYYSDKKLDNKKLLFKIEGALGHIYFQIKKDFAAAKSHYLLALAAYKATTIETDDSVIVIFVETAELFAMANQPEETDNLFRLALSLCESTPALPDQFIGLVYCQYAGYAAQRKDYSGALKLYEQGLARFNKAEAINYTLIAEVYEEIVAIYQATGDREKVLANMLLDLAALEKVDRDDVASFGVVAYNIGILYERMGRKEDALPYFKKCYTDYKKFDELLRKNPGKLDFKTHLTFLVKFEEVKRKLILYNAADFAEQVLQTSIGILKTIEPGKYITLTAEGREVKYRLTEKIDPALLQNIVAGDILIVQFLPESGGPILYYLVDKGAPQK